MKEKPDRQPPERSLKVDTLPAIKVPNRVVWVNEKLRSPFKLEVGEESNLGLMLALSENETQSASFDIGMRELHRRSGDVGQVVFEDVRHRKYRDVDIKGLGLSEHNGLHIEGVGPPIIAKQWHKRSASSDMLGLMERVDAEHDAEIAEQFTEWGIRTHRAVGVIVLEQLSVDGTLMTVRDLKEMHKLPHKAEPAIEIRAFGTKTRISDMRLSIKRVQTESLIRDATNWLQMELGLEKPFTLTEYLKWFAETLGKNVGIMHQHGKVHGNLHEQNITLDCRIVDLDSVRDITELQPYEERNQTLLRDVRGLDSAFSPESGGRMVLWDFLQHVVRMTGGFSNRDATLLLAAYDKSYINEYPEGAGLLLWSTLQNKDKEIPPGRY